MKYVLIIPDGCADEQQAELAGQTPLQAAHVPHMDAVVELGCIGRTDNVPPSMPPGSDVGTMTLFGYDSLTYHTGRAPIEAAALGIALSAADWAIRCNLVTVIDGVMKSFTAGHISSELGCELLTMMQNDLPEDSCWTFYPGVSYRNLLVYRPGDGPAPFGDDIRAHPPHDITDKPIEAFLPEGTGNTVLRELMERSRELFLHSEANQKREHPATQIWLWGLGKKPNLTVFADRFGIRGAVITAVDLLRGMGRLIGWDVLEVDGATGYLDTDYAAKGERAVAALRDYDLVVVHVEATDEASHEGNAAAKVKALEEIDQHIVQPVHQALKTYGAYRLLISPDHPTFLRTKTHSHGYCPFALCGTAIASDSFSRYDELTAAESALAFPKGHELMPCFIQSNLT